MNLSKRFLSYVDRRKGLRNYFQNVNRNLVTLIVFSYFLTLKLGLPIDTICLPRYKRQYICTSAFKVDRFSPAQ